MKYPLFYPFIPYTEIMDELSDTLRGRWIGQAHKVDKFEKKFGNKYGYEYPLFLNSCSSALELAYHLIGISEGDEVITPVLTCTATNIPLLRRKAKIVFADISDNLTVSYEDIKKKITKKTKAIIVVSLGGLECDKRIFKLAKEKNIPVVNDAAQYLGKVQGDYVCYSFQSIKHITTADGGMLVLDNKEEYERAKKLRWFGIDRELKVRHNWQPWERREMTFDIEEAGYKFQPTDIDACFGLAGLKYANPIIKYRKELCEEYQANLHLKTICGGTCWLMGVITENRDELAAKLKESEIETNVVHLRNDIFEIFGGKRQDLPKMNKLEEKYLYLPLNPFITKKDVKFICKQINK